MRFFRNPDGAVHSVPDDFQIPMGADDRPQHGWEEVSEQDAPIQLRGSVDGAQLDPEVVPHELHDLASNPVPDVVSSGYVGDDPAPAEEPTTAPEAAPEPEPDPNAQPEQPENTPAEVSDPAPETPAVTGEGFIPEATQ